MFHIKNGKFDKNIHILCFETKAITVNTHSYSVKIKVEINFMIAIFFGYSTRVFLKVICKTTLDTQAKFAIKNLNIQILH